MNDRQKELLLQYMKEEHLLSLSEKDLFEIELIVRGGDWLEGVDINIKDIY